MAINHDVATFDAADIVTTGASAAISHAGNASARAACVLIAQAGATDEVSGVTYAGAAMSRVRSESESTEPGRVYIYWLDGITGGTQDVVVTTTAGTAKRVIIATMTVAAGMGVEVAGSGTGTSASVANPSWTISSLTAAQRLVAYEVIHSGLQTMTNTPAGSWTLLGSPGFVDRGATGFGTATQTVASSGTSLTCGWTAATAEDFVGDSVAFREFTLPVNAPATEAVGAGTANDASVSTSGGGSSPPAFGTGGTQLQGSAATMNVDVPDSVAADDIVIVFAFLDGDFTVTGLPSGFANAPDSPVAVNIGGGGGSMRLYVMWKRATGADSTAGTYDFTLSASTYRNARAFRYTGAVTSGSPWDVTASAESGATSSNTTAAVSDTTTVADTLLIWMGSVWAGGTWTPPTGFTERHDQGDGNWTLADKAQTSAGATGSITGTCTGTDRNGAWLGALKPAGGGAPATDADAAEATGTGAANAPAAALGVNATEATGAGAGNNPTAASGANAANATATGMANDATVSTATATNANATEAVGTGAANNAAVALQANAGAATGVAEALFDAGSSISLELIADNPIDVVGTAYDATVSTVPATSANATEATGAGTAHNPTAALGANAAVATATGQAFNVGPAVSVFADVATGVGVASDPLIGGAGNAFAGAAVGSGIAYDARTRKLIVRPFTGTVTRPTSGTVPRPDTGVVLRP